jgi:hypothetical protein
VRSATDRRGRVTPLLAAILLAACTQVSPSPEPSEPDATQLPSVASAEPSEADEPSESPGPSAAAGPGRPYDAADILEAMRTSPRPDGVPEALQTDAIASAIADEIWTIDGDPWDTILIGASCGPDTCLVEVVGSRDDAADDDAWNFGVDPDTGEVSVGATDLRALPPSLVADLDRLARSLVADAPIGSMVLANVAWLPPAEVNRFAMSYRTGGEEGSCGVDVVIDAEERLVVDQQTLGDC